MARPVIDILMYHSIAVATGPTSIAPEVFRAQMAAIAEAGVPVITLDDLLAARKGRALPPYSVILTFDDGYQDFAEAAWPVMQPLGFRPMVYLPTAHIGRMDGWTVDPKAQRPIMGWPLIRSLAEQGVQFGSHSVSHRDLDSLDPEVLEAELIRSRSEIEKRLGRPVPHFAPPYGVANAATRRAIAAHYKTSVGTILNRAGVDDDLFNLPRLEMFYFTDLARWRRQLAGRGTGYLLARKTLRRVGLALRIRSAVPLPPA